MRNFLRSLGIFILDVIETIVIALSIFVIIYLFFAQPHQVKGDSMLPSFKNGEYLLTNKVSYYFNEPQRGDVVIFKFPKNPRFDYIKRIVALPEEEIEIKNGKIIIYNKEHPQGFFLSELYLGEGVKTNGRSAIAEGKKIKIPQGHYIVFGDNRDKSSDSREWGTVPRDHLIGKAWLVYWPPQALAFIPEVEYE